MTDDKKEISAVEEGVEEETPIPINSLTEKHLEKWDRSLSDEKRCYGIKLLIAGAESPALRDGLYRIGVRRILVSYYYLRKWLKKHSVQEIAEEFGRFDFVFLDSGGFTLIQERKKNPGADLGVKDYAEDYYTELERVGHIFSGCAEVDVRSLGTEYMERKKEECLEKGIPIVPVLQPPEFQPYVDLGWFEKYPYISVGSALHKPQFKGYLNAMYKTAMEHNVLLHGLGVTKADTMARSRFYSVDSTTWLNGSKYGETMIFQNGRVRHYDAAGKGVRKKYRGRFEACGLFWEDIENDKYTEIDLMNALAWSQYADYSKYSATKCYWLTSAEKDAALSLKSKLFNAEGIINREMSLTRAETRRLTQVDNAGEDDRAHEFLYCDTCHASERCPRFKKSQPCGYDINVRLETNMDFQRAVQVVLELEYGRVMTASIFEKMDGGILDKNLSNEMQKFLGMLQQAKGIFSAKPEPREELELKISGSKGGGAVTQMLASVFANTGSGTSGSGNSTVQRLANDRIIDVEKE